MTSGCTEKQRLWVVTDRYYPEAASTGEYLTQIAEELIEEFDVKVICGPPNGSARGPRIPDRETRNGVEIFRVRRTLPDKGVVANRVVNPLNLGLATFWRSLRSFRQGDKVLVVTAPPYLPFTIAIASLVKGSSYSLLINDLYPDLLVDSGRLRHNSLPVKVMHFANAWLFKHAARIIVVGQNMAELVSVRTNGSGVPIKTIPHWDEYDCKDELLETGKRERSAAKKTYNFGVALQRFREALR